jgi:hypothetical protein
MHGEWHASDGIAPQHRLPATFIETPYQCQVLHIEYLEQGAGKAQQLAPHHGVVKA